MEVSAAGLAPGARAPVTAPSGRRLAPSPAVLVAIAGVGALALHMLYYARLIGFDPVDDAYISFRYAVNGARGHGPVFNVAERVEGYTNYLWVALLRGLAALGLDVPAWSMVLGALLALATLALLWPASRRGTPGAAALAALLLAADGSFALWAVSGLETALFTFLVLAGAVAFVRELERGEPGLSPILFALAAMARPEGVLIFAITVCYQAGYSLASKGRRLQPADLARLLLFLGIYGAYFLWRWGYYGFLLPNTFYAKVETVTPDAQIDRGLAHLGTFLRVHYGPALPLLMALPFVTPFVVRLWQKRAQRLKREPSLPWGMTVRWEWGYYLLLVLVYCAYIVYVGGDWSVGRFFVPVLPFAYLLAAEGVAQLVLLVRSACPLRRSALLSLALVLAAGAVSVAMAYRSSYRGERELYALPYEVRLASQARRAAGTWLREHAPAGSLLLVDAAGQVPYYSGLRAIDLFGLTDAHLAHQRITIGRGTPGHEKVDIEYLLGQRPDYIVIYGRALDGYSDRYARVDDWTDDVHYARFLSIYRRR